MSVARARLSWTRRGRVHEALEPDRALVSRHAETLARWYNAPENAMMMGGSGGMTAADVVDFYEELAAAGGHGFLAFVDGALVGDADLRRVRGDVAEFALMIGASAQKGRGLGGTFAAMVHVFAFRELGLARLYVPPRRDNVVVQRLNRTLGYDDDDGPEARSFADDEDCITMSISAETFAARNAEAMREVEVHGAASASLG